MPFLTMVVLTSNLPKLPPDYCTETDRLESSECVLNIASLRQGVYILKAESGESRAVEKLVVE